MESEVIIKNNEIVIKIKNDCSQCECKQSKNQDLSVTGTVVMH